MPIEQQMGEAQESDVPPDAPPVAPVVHAIKIESAAPMRVRRRRSSALDRSTLLDCCIAIGGVAIALLLRRAMNPLLGRNEAFITFFIALIFATWFGGLAPAVLTFILGLAAGTYFFVLPHQPSAHATPADFVPPLLFCAAGVIVICFGEAGRRTRQRLEDASEQIELQQEELDRQIPARTTAEQSLRGSDALNRQMRDSSLIGILTFDAETNLVHVNDTFLHMLGWTREDLAKDAHALSSLFSHRSTAEAYESTLSHHGRSSGVPVLIHDMRSGSTGAGVVFILDRSSHVQAQWSLQLQNRVLESMAEGVVVAGPNGIITLTNASLEHLFGYARDELIGSKIAALSALSDNEHRELIEKIGLALRVRGNWLGELQNRRKDGSACATEAHISALRDGEGQEQWIYVHHDLSLHKRNEQA